MYVKIIRPDSTFVRYDKCLHVGEPNPYTEYDGYYGAPGWADERAAAQHTSPPQRPAYQGK